MRVENKVDYPEAKNIACNTPRFQNNNFQEQINPYAKPCGNMCCKCSSHANCGKTVNLIERGEDKDAEDDCDEDVAEEEGEELALVLQ